MKRMRMRHSRKARLQVLERRFALDATGMGMSDLELQKEDCDTPLDSEIAPQAQIYTMAAMEAESSEVAEVGTVGEEVLDTSLFIRTLDFESSSADVDLMSQTGMVDDEMVRAFSASDMEATEEEIFEVTATGNTDEVAEELMTFNSAGSAFSFDVDANGRISPLDAYLIISAINDFYESHGLSDPAASGLGSTFDINRDSLVSPLDVLIVINQINRLEELDWFMIDAPEVSGNTSIRIGDDLQDQNATDGSEDAAQGILPDDDADMRQTDDGLSSSRLMAPIDSIVVTGSKQNGDSMIFTLNADGKISAIADGVELNLSVDEQGSIWVNDQPSGLSVIQTEGKYELSQTSKETEWTFVWASDIDHEFAMLA